jgi:hypothetical protein
MIRGAAILCLALLAVPAPGALAQESRPVSDTAPANNKELVASFHERVKEYVKLRERLERRLPKLSKNSTAEELTAHEDALQKLVREARAAAKPGDLFSPAIAEYIRATIVSEFRGADRKDLRETVLEADTKGVPLRVNYPYPEQKELTQIPPTLLLRLPELPEEVKYRFVGRSLLLVDRKSEMIVDYMPNALP